MADFSQWYDPSLEALAPVGAPAPPQQQDWSGSVPTTWVNPSPVQSAPSADWSHYTSEHPLARAIVSVAAKRGLDPLDLMTVIGFETGGTYDPKQPGPITKWGQHIGLFQAGEPQRLKYGYDPNGSIDDQAESFGRYLDDTGVKPGMGLRDIYSAVNAGYVGRGNRSDTAAGGTWGTVDDKVDFQMGPHRAKALQFLTGKWEPGSKAPQSRGEIYASAQSKTRSMLVPVDHDPFNVGVGDSGGNDTGVDPTKLIQGAQFLTRRIFPAAQLLVSGVDALPPDAVRDARETGSIGTRGVLSLARLLGAGAEATPGLDPSLRGSIKGELLSNDVWKGEDGAYYFRDATGAAVQTKRNEHVVEYGPSGYSVYRNDIDRVSPPLPLPRPPADPAQARQWRRDLDAQTYRERLLGRVGGEARHVLAPEAMVRELQLPTPTSPLDRAGPGFTGDAEVAWALNAAGMASTGGAAVPMPKAVDPRGFRIFGKRYETFTEAGRERQVVQSEALARAGYKPEDIGRMSSAELQAAYETIDPSFSRMKDVTPGAPEPGRGVVTVEPFDPANWALREIGGYSAEQIARMTPEQRAAAARGLAETNAWGPELNLSTEPGRPGSQGAIDAAAKQSGPDLTAPGPAAVDAGAGGGRGSIGTGSLAEAQGAAARSSAGAYVPEGLPTRPLKLADPDGTPQWFVPAPLAQAQKLAADYAQQAGFDYSPPRQYIPVDPARASRIADAFAQMPHAPDDPIVKAAYKAMIDETVAQMDQVLRAGLKIEFIKPGQVDPYATSPRLAQKDVVENNHLWVFPTDTGFGSGSAGSQAALANNPLLASTKFNIDGRQLLANDVFRIVHDYFGHFKDGNGFRADGEEHAWRAHSAMYSPLARRAMTTETRGQNSWLNYGPHGDKNRTAVTADTTFADQKTGLLPEWVVEEGRLDPVQAQVKGTTPGIDGGGYAPDRGGANTTLFSNKRPVVLPAAERGRAMLEAMGKPTKGLVTLTPEEKLSPAYRAYSEGGDPRVATLEVATTNTKQGARASELAAAVPAERPSRWQRQALTDLEALQRDTMARLGGRGPQGQPSPVERLISSALGADVRVDGIDTKGYGTFEGVLSPNMRIPLLGRSSGSQMWNLSEPLHTPARRAILAALGQDLDQTASAASQFRWVRPDDPAGKTYSIFAPGEIDRVAVGQIEKALGYPLNIHSVAGGTMIDINVGGFDTLPTFEGVSKAVEKVLPGRDVYVARRAYDSDYIDRSEYRQAIDDYWKGASNGREVGENAGGVGGARSPAGSYDDWTAARQAIKGIAKERDRGYAGWTRQYERQFAAEGLTELPSVERLAAEVPGLKAVMKYMTPDERVKLRRDTAQKIVDLFESLPSAEEMAAVAHAGRAKRGWYRDSSKAIVEVFGADDAPRFAALLAAMSPQVSVEMNLHNALKTWGNWVAAGRPTEPAEIVRIMGRSVLGAGGEASILDAWKNNSIRALRESDPMEIVLSGAKVSNFTQNLRDNVNAVTVDAWMANYANVSQELFNGPAGKPDDLGTLKGASVGYSAMAAAVRRAADVATQKTGQKWTPEEIQETVWSWAKSLYETSEKMGVTTTELLRAGGLTHEQIRQTPDFGRLFVSNVYRKLLEEGGYAKEVEAQLVRGGERDAARDGSRGDAGSAEGSGFTQSAFERHLKRAAERLENLRNERAAGRAKPVDEEAVNDALDERFNELAAKYEDNGMSRAEAEARAREEVYGETKLMDGVPVKPVDDDPFGGTDVFSNRRPMAVPQIDSPRFKRWFGSSKVVDEAGAPKVVYHGTASEFDRFDPTRADVESDLGAGFYFTNNPKDVATNYATSAGADITNRIERAAERILQDEGFLGTKADAKAAARAALSVQHEGATVPVYLRMRKPVEIGGPNETFFDLKEKMDRRGEYTGEVSGKLPKFLDALDDVLAKGDFYDVDVSRVRNAVLEAALDNGGLAASKLLDTLKHDRRTGGDMVYAVNDAGDLAGTEIIRRAMEKMGFDGFIDRTVHSKFGAAGMEGMSPDTVHYVVFRPEQIKSATGNSGTFDPKNPSILYSNKRPLIVPPGERAPTFYSGLEAAVMGAKLSNAPASQWLGAIKNMPGVKQEELDWVGLPEWLNEQKGLITKQQIEDFVAQNKVQIEEVVQGGGMSINEGSRYAGVPEFMAIAKKARSADDARIMLANDEAAYRAAQRIPELKKQVDESGDTWQRIVTNSLVKDGGVAKFSNYQMEGPKDNYRNILLKLPVPERPVDVRQGQSKLTDEQLDALLREQREVEDRIDPEMGVSMSGERAYNLLRSEPGETIWALPEPDKFPEWFRQLSGQGREDFLNAGRNVLRRHPEYARYQEITDAVQAEYQARINDSMAATAARKPRDDVFRVESHWGDEPNVLAHARVNDRILLGPDKFVVENVLSGNRSQPFDTVAEAEVFQKTLPAGVTTRVTKLNGEAKTLFIEEVQSDWHQKGRDQGYRGEEIDLGRDGKFTLPQGVTIERMANNPWHKNAVAYVLKRGDEVLAHDVTRFDLLRKATDKGIIGTPVIDAPLKQTTGWAGMVMKRMIREAAENGYDQIAWTPGDVQNERWSRELQQVSQVSYNPEKKQLLAYRSGEDVEPVVDEMVEPNRLSSYIGRSAAEDILNQKPNRAGFHILRGKDLKVGGVAFREFYDKILVNIANSIGKKYGAKVGVGDVEGGGKVNWTIKPFPGGGGYRIVTFPGGEYTPGIFKTETEAMLEANKQYGRAKDGQKVWVMPITPELRDAAVGKGFPLFMKGVPVVRVDHDPFEEEGDGRQRAAAGR